MATTTAFETVPVTGCLGAELRGIDLRTMDDATFTEVERALVEHEVIFVRDAHLTENEQLALGERFGSLNLFPVAKLLGATEKRAGVFLDTTESPPVADAWHTDVTWIDTPPDVAILCSVIGAERGGDTMWASMTAAYEALSRTMQQLICGLAVRHDNESFIRGMLAKSPEFDGPGGLPERLRAEYPPVEHPLVRTHPVSGRRALFLGGGFMRGIVGMNEDESAAILGFLQTHAGNAKFVCGWHWRAGDVAIWDERSTNHRAAGGRFVGRREMRRVECGASTPVFDPDAVAWPRD